jgi:hypothetical protein
MEFLTNILNNQFKDEINSIELREYYLISKENEPQIIEPINYKISLNEIRPQIINWIIFLCDNLNFSIQTLFRTVIIFDQYIGKIKIENLNKKNIQLIAIACLSLGTKIEEMNCNYIKFFTDKVLNTPNNKEYSYKDLSKMEFKILNILNFKTLYSTPINFAKIYFELLKKTNLVNKIFLTNFWNYYLLYLKKILINEMYITYFQSEISYFIFIQCCYQFNINSNIFKTIYNTINCCEKKVKRKDSKIYNMISIHSL